MYSRHLGFLLLLWIPEALHAQDDRLPCAAPTLEGGVFAPHEESYPHGMTLVYNCEDGLKAAAVDSWWASVKCQNGRWSHTPQCSPIDLTDPGAGLGLGFTEVSKCGHDPIIPHWRGMTVTPMYITYSCKPGYALVGSEKVMCYNDGMWTKIPTCREAFCIIPAGCPIFRIEYC
ncbi:coagulation factor XIII B chain-like isoform X2 [Antennarius striatus]|uniref:coagulation factor XIII B chain-like isoform X2 n=1 Tax=Antennarius striatus TaxID=241820 RepID=UPI0035B4A1E2